MDTVTKVLCLPGDFLLYQEGRCRVWFLFSSPANEPCLLRSADTGAWGQRRTTGLREGHSRHSCVCLTQQGGLFLGGRGRRRRRGRGMETLGLEEVWREWSTLTGKSEGKMWLKEINRGQKCPQKYVCVCVCFRSPPSCGHLIILKVKSYRKCLASSQGCSSIETTQWWLLQRRLEKPRESSQCNGESWET